VHGAHASQYADCGATLDLMQWYAHLKAAFPDAEVGLLGGGSAIAPDSCYYYDSGAIMQKHWATNMLF